MSTERCKLIFSFKKTLRSNINSLLNIIFGVVCSKSYARRIPTTKQYGYQTRTLTPLNTSHVGEEAGKQYAFQQRRRKVQQEGATFEIIL